MAGCDQVIATRDEAELRDKARAFVRRWTIGRRPRHIPWGQWEHLVNEPCPEMDRFA